MKNGFTLIEMLVSFGLMSVFALGSANLFTNVQKRQKGIEGHAQVEALTSQLSLYMSETSLCAAAIGAPFTINPTTSKEQPKAGLTITGPNGQILAKQGMVFGGQLTVSKVKVQVLGPAGPNRLLADLKIGVDKSAQAIGAPTAERSIPIILDTATVGPATQVVDCNIVPAATPPAPTVTGSYQSCPCPGAMCGNGPVIHMLPVSQGHCFLTGLESNSIGGGGKVEIANFAGVQTWTVQGLKKWGMGANICAYARCVKY